MSRLTDEIAQVLGPDKPCNAWFSVLPTDQLVLVQSAFERADCLGFEYYSFLNHNARNFDAALARRATDFLLRSADGARFFGVDAMHCLCEAGHERPRIDDRIVAWIRDGRFDTNDPVPWSQKVIYDICAIDGFLCAPGTSVLDHALEEHFETLLARHETFAPAAGHAFAAIEMQHPRCGRMSVMIDDRLRQGAAWGGDKHRRLATILMGGLSGMAGRIAETGRTEVTGPISRLMNLLEATSLYDEVRGTPDRGHSQDAPRDATMNGTGLVEAGRVRHRRPQS